MFYNLNRRKKRHFQEAMTSAYKKIWDLEFMRLQLRNMREGFRTTYDRLHEEEVAYGIRISKLKEMAQSGQTIDTQDLENSEKKLASLAQDCEQLKKQMDGVDKQIEGYNKEEQHFEGINETIEAHQANIALFKEYLKTL